MTEQISVQCSDTKVLVTIFCKDSTEAQQVAAELAADTNSGKFMPSCLEPRVPIVEKEHTEERYRTGDHERAGSGITDGPIPVRKE